jgi:YD repeat-containing protein
MKRFLLAAVFACIASAASAQHVVTYDRQGNPVGHVSGATAYDRNGQLTGTAAPIGNNLYTWTNRDGSRGTYKVIKRGNTTLILGNGPLAGKIIQNGNRRTHYDRYGRMIGTSQ